MVGIETKAGYATILALTLLITTGSVDMYEKSKIKGFGYRNLDLVVSKVTGYDSVSTG